MPPRKLTTRLLSTLAAGERVRDTDARGLFVEVTSAGVVTFKFQADLRTGPRKAGARRTPKTIRMTLGALPDLTLDAARARATALRADIRAGRDPRPGAATPGTWTVQAAYDEYLRGREGTATDHDMRARLARYLSDWASRPLAEITRDECVARHAKIAADVKARAKTKRATGAKSANATIKDLRAVWAYVSDITELPPDPTRKIRLLGEAKVHHDIPIASLPAWWAATGKLASPIRRGMHRVALLTGLRPSNVARMRRAWLHLDEPGRERVVIPRSEMKTKKGPEFVLPLSSAAAAILREVLAFGAALHPGSPWVFPSRALDGTVIPMASVREKAVALRDATGHALRHLWKTCARNARLPEVSIELLLDHAQPAMAAAYGSLAEQFERLREDAETVSEYILARTTRR
ncbi:MAG TPA: integrase arm-type DNA-binding domain-containing protein [Polyangiaceae bacterium]|nr:integrase arm-type DNA-binding domain-containing protein [Polyangiaceae bacterium]